MDKPLTNLNLPLLNVSEEEFNRHFNVRKVCALSNSKQIGCCGGRGYFLKEKGAYTVARVCDCIKGCSLCAGSGLIDYNDQHNEDTGAVLKQPCHRPYFLKVINLFEAAQIPARYFDASFKEFNSKIPDNRALAKKLHDWAESYQIGDKGILLSGPVGVGKTYLLCSLAKKLLERGITVKFIDFFQLIAQIRAGFVEQVSDQGLIAPLIDVDVLIIDEMGKGRNTDFENTVVDQLIMGRYNQKKTILASTNYTVTAPRVEPTMRATEMYQISTMKTLESSLEERVGARVFSRLVQMCKFAHMTGADERKTKWEEL